MTLIIFIITALLTALVGGKIKSVVTAILR